MDGAQAPAGFKPDVLSQVGPALKGLVDQGALSGVVTLVWRLGSAFAASSALMTSACPSDAAHISAVSL